MYSTKWKLAKARQIGKGYKIIYYGIKTTQNGIVVVISKQFLENVIEVDNIFDFLNSVTIILGSTTIHIICPPHWQPRGCVGADKHVLIIGDLHDCAIANTFFKKRPSQPIPESASQRPTFGCYVAEI